MIFVKGHMITEIIFTAYMLLRVHCSKSYHEKLMKKQGLNFHEILALKNFEANPQTVIT